VSRMEASMAETRSYSAAVQAEGVPVTKMTGMMKIMTGFNPKSITSDAELAELSGLLRDSGSTQRPPMRKLNRSSDGWLASIIPISTGNKQAEEK